jgi:hypothetical protein
VNFEAFRDLVRMLQLGISEETAILLAEDENLEQRASAKSSAVGQLNLQLGQSKGPQPHSLALAGRFPPCLCVPLLLVRKIM